MKSSLSDRIFTSIMILILLARCEPVLEIEENHLELPLVKLTIDEYYLYSPDSGLFVIGESGVTDWKDDVGNYYAKWEHPARVQMEIEGDEIFDDTVGFRIKASSGRDRPNKSMSLYWREEYGKKRLREEFLFPGNETIRYKRLKLDAGETIIKNSIVEEILRKNINVEISNRRQVNLLINDKYWGLYNLQEQITPHHFEYHYGIDDDLINIIEFNPLNPSVDDGSSDQWVSVVLPLLSSLDFSKNESVEEIGQYVELSSVIDYFIAETYVYNYDWPVNNMKWWSAREDSQYSKWKYILNDMDFAFLMKHVNHLWLGEFYSNTENRRTEYREGFLLLDKLMLNSAFRKRFFRRYLEVIDEVFDQDRVDNIIEKHIDYCSHDYPIHASKWGYVNRSQWKKDIRELSDFNRQRRRWLRPKIQEWYNKEVLTSDEED